MRGPKDEEKIMSPIFPRLHVNDTEKGGPKAPPRNKMALYEQLSIPSQRFSSGSSSMLPLPPNNGNKLIPSMALSQGGSFERSTFCNSPASSLSEESFSHSFGGVKLSTKMASPEWKSMNSTDDRNLKTTQPLSFIAESNSFQSHNFANFKNVSCNKFGDEKDFGVPTSSQSGAVLLCSSKHNKEQDSQPCWNLSFSMQFQNGSEKRRKGTGTVNQKARESMRKQAEENAKISHAFLDPVERPASVPSVQDKTSVDASSSPSAKVKRTESLKRAHPLSNQENSSSSGNVLKGLHGTNSWLNKNFIEMQDRKIVHKDKDLVEFALSMGKENASKMRHESCSWFSLGNYNRSHSDIENVIKTNQDKYGSLQVGNVQRRDDVSKTSMMDSVSAFGITSDNVIRVIGEGQFWEARRAIVKQQREFKIQVFELHRLIKVQMLIAGSPDLLLEDNIYLAKASLEVSPVKKVASENAREQPPLIDKQKDVSQKPYPSAEFADENAVVKLPLPHVNNETSKGLLTQQSNDGSHSEGVLLSPIAANTRQSPWCFPPQGNQWLVPVMSHSEGLVYKPYAGPCPPTAGFIAPVYGKCGPMNLPAGGGDFLNAACGVQQGIGILPMIPPLGQTYFPPHAMPVMSPSISVSAVELVTPFIAPPSKDNQSSAGDIKFAFPHQSSCNMLSQMSRVILCGGKFQASKESEVQESTASSPFKRPKGDALPFFPTEPTTQVSDPNVQLNELRTHVIKVVPHNPKSATESAARIFQSIQEERKLYD
ncbi:hypothetical protein JCGZ_24819 [Jatropha curcas]|uniref:Protein EARLY FLOWERING 3 n=1 Tax=Jatropha curcas TaxID=180498 RepID=A0A067L8K0_JATCU|nr:ELF3-like protein 2 [Jatropha curcas]KDP40820.1 hypothetical protein JCGZ_24819 [Jatropha curcas]